MKNTRIACSSVAEWIQRWGLGNERIEDSFEGAGFMTLRKAIRLAKLKRVVHVHTNEEPLASEAIKADENNFDRYRSCREGSRICYWPDGQLGHALASGAIVAELDMQISAAEKRLKDLLCNLPKMEDILSSYREAQPAWFASGLELRRARCELRAAERMAVSCERRLKEAQKLPGWGLPGGSLNLLFGGSENAQGTAMHWRQRSRRVVILVDASCTHLFVGCCSSEGKNSTNFCRTPDYISTLSDSAVHMELNYRWEVAVAAVSTLLLEEWQPQAQINTDVSGSTLKSQQYLEPPKCSHSPVHRFLLAIASGAIGGVFSFPPSSQLARTSPFPPSECCDFSESFSDDDELEIKSSPAVSQKANSIGQNNQLKDSAHGSDILQGGIKWLKSRSKHIGGTSSVDRLLSLATGLRQRVDACILITSGRLSGTDGARSEAARFRQKKSAPIHVVLLDPTCNSGVLALWRAIAAERSQPFDSQAQPESLSHLTGSRSQENFDSNEQQALRADSCGEPTSSINGETAGSVHGSDIDYLTAGSVRIVSPELARLILDAEASSGGWRVRSSVLAQRKERLEAGLRLAQERVARFLVDAY